MVLAELGQKISNALKKLNQAHVVDEKFIQEVVTDIASALLSADVNIKFVARLQNAVKTQVSLHMNTTGGDGFNMRKLI